MGTSATAGIAIGYGAQAGEFEINIGGVRLDLVKLKVNEIITWINSNGGSISPL
jgi:hypothetical protein